MFVERRDGEKLISLVLNVAIGLLLCPFLVLLILVRSKSDIHRVGHVVQSDDVRPLQLDHGKLLLRQRWQDPAVAAEKDDVVFVHAEVGRRIVLTNNCANRLRNQSSVTRWQYYFFNI